jgi:hypothetical protein
MARRGRRERKLDFSKKKKRKERERERERERITPIILLQGSNLIFVLHL